MTTGQETEVFTAPAAGSNETATAPPKVELPEAPDSETKQQPPAGTPESPPEPPSLEDQVKDLKGRLDEEQHRRVSAEGRLTAGTSPAMAAMALEIKGLKHEMRRGQIEALPEEQQKAPLDQLRVEEEQATTEAGFASYTTRMAERMNRRLATAGVGADDPRVVNIRTQWGTAKTEDAVDDVVDLVDALVDDVFLERVNAKAQTTPPAQNTTVPRGGPAQTDQAWLDAYGDEEDTTIPPNPENAAKAKTLMAKGLSPKPR